MRRLRNFWRKSRHAGFAWTGRALARRVQLSASRLGPMRAIAERAHRVSDQSVLDDIDFDDCADGDFASRFIGNPMGRHFFDESIDTLEYVRTRFPESIDQTMEAAEAAFRREFQLLGRTAAFAGAIDWYWIPDTDDRWPVVPVDRYAPAFYNDPGRPGDVKYPWELNRHQHFVTLAKAYLLSGDSKYIAEIQRQFLSWQEQNPFRTGINWYSSLELGIRLIAWTNTIVLLRAAPRPDPELIRQMIRAAYRHAHYLDRTLTTHWLVANNHLIGETAGLFAFAATFPEFRASSRWRKRSLHILTDALRQQIFSDGVNCEQATGYHRFVLDFLVLVDRLAAANNIALPEVFSATLKSMLRYEARVAPPDGGLAPSVGDCDDGRGLLLGENSVALDFRGWLAYGAVRFDDADLAALAREGSEESAWLLGADGLQRFESMTRSEVTHESKAFRNGGHYILRADSDRGSIHVFVRCGPFGLGGEGSSVHSHADLLAPVIRWRGRELAVDSGTFGYLCDRVDRDRYRAGAAHNTFLPEGVDQGEMQPLWNWSSVPVAKVLSWNTTDLRTEFRGLIESPNGFQHERAITLERSLFALSIEDELIYSKGTRATWRLHLGPGLDVERLDERSMRIYDGEDFAVELHHIGFTSDEIVDAEYAPRYGELQRIRCIELNTTDNPARVRVALHDPDSALRKPRKD